MTLSEAAKSALIDAGTSRQGVTVKSTNPKVVYELRTAGLIGDGYGLTRKGTIERERVLEDQLEAAFG